MLVTQQLISVVMAPLNSTESSIRLLSTSDPLFCLCSRILTSACVTLPCTFHSIILLQAHCNFISHNETFLYTPEGRRGAVMANQHICSGQKGEKKLLQPLLISRSFTLFLGVQTTALLRRCAVLLPVVHHRFGAMHTLHLIYLFISSIFFLPVYICVELCILLHFILCSCPYLLLFTCLYNDNKVKSLMNLLCSFHHTHTQAHKR